MMKLSEPRSSMLNGVLLMALFSCAAFYIGNTEMVKTLSLSPLVVGIVLGMLYANSLRGSLPETWVPGISFTAKRILRLGIILYGFRLSFQDVVAVGLPAVVIDAVVVSVTILLGVFLGKLLRMDRSIALLTSCGSAICGAAAIMGLDGAIRPKPYKTAVAVATVVLFGTLSMFLYPVVLHSGILRFTDAQAGLFLGSTIHEVAHVVGAGNAMGAMVSDTAIIVKMIRVMMLVPVLLVVAFVVARSASARNAGRARVSVPWFALLFLCVIGVNSLSLLPAGFVHFIQEVDTFLLTMAMCALGAETHIDKFRQAGVKPFILAFLLWCWLTLGGIVLVEYVSPLLY